MTNPNSKMSGRFLALLITFAIAVGVIHILPSAYVPLRLGGAYRGIFPFQSADEEHYDVCIKAAMEGFYHNRNNYLQEGSTEPSGSLPPFRPEAILGYIGKKIGFGIATYIVFLRFLLPVIAFIILLGNEMDISFLFNLIITTKPLI